MKRGRAILLLVAVVALVALGAEAQAPAKVVFALNWFAVGDHAAYWVAVDRGYYKARGLEVELQNSKGSGDPSRRSIVAGPTSGSLTPLSSFRAWRRGPRSRSWARSST